MKYSKQLSIYLLLLLFSIEVPAQCFMPTATDLYASPNGTGNGMSYNSPTDLQTGLNSVQPGQTLWLLGGQYNGRFYANGASGTEQCPITVSSYPGEWAVLNGNVKCESLIIGIYQICGSILTVLKPNYHFKDFEITFVGEDYLRDANNSEFSSVGGINHPNGKSCKFLNLIIHDVTGNGMGSWKSTHDSEIYGCLIYNNGNEIGEFGFSGTGIYIQNNGETIRKIKNNILFNNFKAGAKLWSASDIPPETDYLKNLDFDDNVILNTGSPINLSRGRECLILAGRSEVEGEAIVHNVNVRRNFMYHRTNYGIGNHAEVFRIGTEEVNSSVYFNYAYKINVLDNYIIGRKEGLRLIRVGTDFSFKNNIVQSDYVYSVNNVNAGNNFNMMTHDNWHFDKNTYFSKYYIPYPITQPDRVILFYMKPGGLSTNRSLEEMIIPPPTGEYGIETYNSSNYRDNLTSNDLFEYLGTQKTISVIQNYYKPHLFKVVVFDKFGDPVKVDLANYGISDGMPYTIRDAENYFNIFDGFESIYSTVKVPMGLTLLDTPSGVYPSKTISNIIAKKSEAQVGVFIVEFQCQPDYLLQDIIETSNIDYKAGITIKAAGGSTYYKIKSGIKVNHIAGKAVSLKPGFHAPQGAIYNAKVEFCQADIPYTGEPLNNYRIATSSSDEFIEDESKFLKIFPNPAENHLIVKSSSPIEYYELTNHIGHVFNKIRVSKENQREIRIDNLNLVPGLYILRVTLISGENISKQFIKK